MTATELQKVAKVREAFRTGRAREIRLSARASLEEAAAATGCITAPTLWRWENSESAPRAAHALAYARVLEYLERELKK
jgi:transcriptional regulator with XRE-family HTH domain